MASVLEEKQEQFSTNSMTMSDTIPTAIPPTTVSEFNKRIPKVLEGIDLLLSQYSAAGQQLFPRKMAIGDKFGITVNSKEDIFSECMKASFVDCRLNSYPVVSENDINYGLVAPTMLFADVDTNNVNIRKVKDDNERTIKIKDEKSFVKKVRDPIKERIQLTFGVQPTILSTGGGEH
jgi:hypothetical protein